MTNKWRLTMGFESEGNMVDWAVYARETGLIPDDATIEMCSQNLEDEPLLLKLDRLGAVVNATGAMARTLRDRCPLGV